MDEGRGKEFLTKNDPLEEGVTTHTSALDHENPADDAKGKDLWPQKMIQIGELKHTTGRTEVLNSEKSEANGPKQKRARSAGVSCGESKSSKS